MTPMIDVLLVLIIIFMVITPLTPHGLEALVPQPPPPGCRRIKTNSRTVVISINKRPHHADQPGADELANDGGAAARHI